MAQPAQQRRPSARPEAKVLRIAVIRGGKIIDDRYFPKKDDVTVGDSTRNTFAMPMAHLPESHALFVNRGGQHFLAFTDQMTGEVQVGGDGSRLDFAALKAQGIVKKQGGAYLLPLNENSKGKVHIGEAVFLFQFAAPPPTPPKPELPREARGTLWNTVDRTFATCLASVVLFNASTIIAVTARDIPPEEENVADIPDEFAKILIPEKPPEEPKEEEKPVEEVVEAAPEKKTDKKPEEAPKSAEQKAAEIKKTVESKGLVKILGAVGSGPGGSALANVFAAGGGFTADIGAALAGAGGVAVATDPGAGGPKGGAGGEAAGIGQLGTSGAGDVAGPSKREVAIRGNVSADADAEVSGADVDKDALNKYIRARLKAIQGCYEKELKRNPSLRGKITVRFTIATNGRISEVEVEQNTMGDENVSSCIARLIKTWRMPFTPESDVPVSFPFVFSPSS